MQTTCTLEAMFFQNTYGSMSELITDTGLRRKTDYATFLASRACFGGIITNCLGLNANVGFLN